MATVAQDVDFDALRRKEFAWTEDVAYLNAASYGPLPERSRRAIDAFNRRRQDVYRLEESDLTEPLVRARHLLGRLIGASEQEIALGPNTSHGLALAARCLKQLDGGSRSGADRSRVVVSDREFPANVVPWKALADRGVSLEIVPTDDMGRPREDLLLEKLGQDDVVAFALSAVQFASGHRADLARFGRFCRERDILFVVDAIQSLGAIPLDVRDAKIDILCAGGQKWLCGPFGAGFVYVRRELCDRLDPPVPGWLAFSASEDFSSLLDYDSELFEDARRFETGTLGAQDFLGLATSVAMILDLGVESIWRHIQDVQQPLIDWLSARDDVDVISDLTEAHRSGIICIRPPAAERVQAALSEAGVVSALREGAIRFSPHLYNSVAELERVAQILDHAI